MTNNNNDELKKKIEAEGHEASEDELEGEPTTEEAAENDGPSEDELPEDTDGVAEENMFSSAD